MFMDRMTWYCHNTSSSQLDLYFQHNSNKNTSSYFVVTDKLILKFLWEAKDSESPTQYWWRRTNLENKCYLTSRFAIKLQLSRQCGIDKRINKKVLKNDKKVSTSV